MKILQKKVVSLPAITLLATIASMAIMTPMLEAKQVVKLKADDEKAVWMSSLELNRMKAVGDRITHVRGNEGEFDMVSDKESGEVYIKPKKIEQTHIFVSTEKGHTYKIGIKSSEIAAEQIFLENEDALIKEESLKRTQERGVDREAMMVIKAMRSGNIPEGYIQSPTKKSEEIRKIERNLGVRVVQERLYTGEKYIGEKLVIRPLKNSNQTIEEGDFYPKTVDGRDIIAVSIDKKPCKKSSAKEEMAVNIVKFR